MVIRGIQGNRDMGSFIAGQEMAMISPRFAEDPGWLLPDKVTRLDKSESCIFRSWVAAKEVNNSSGNQLRGGADFSLAFAGFSQISSAFTLSGQTWTTATMVSYFQFITCRRIPRTIDHSLLSD
ncbi:hypothetical protein ASPBRDRAFT_479220 [Aspergillus brasiliensis CBS 101740]|uniref:Uncharacterized protein n=1 Tax=Aspergillus brasiliensis (strain CBS 101740 / IMI 381727 / IBT 21946) TaxID=767769 RepID=A0A1L9UTZ7_ASPBC|nr:hypothetical protein ASPBRDRAFT_479220 [Aspergillus brasiliensis CBS 101740]